MAHQKQVLIVEDNEINRAILSEILSGTYRVLEAENGQQALDVLRQHRDDVSLILLDVMMPVMDGYTFLDRIRDEDELALIPVIVMTQSDSEEDEVAALTHGATDFVPKPYRPQVILHRVASLIKLRETAAMVNQFQFDRLTGLYSKEFFYQMVRERLDKNPGKRYSIVCSDIENFKLYNDAFGRKAGDRLLQENAEILQRIVGEDGLCGRYGADCFLVLLEQEREQADRTHFFGTAYEKRSEKLGSVSIKWGIYEITDRTVPVEQMCDWALLAAKSVKGQYNRPFAVYDDAPRNQLLREKAITDVMETALAEEQFIVYLQPKFSLNEDCMAGAEALVRWIHPEWGFMSPGEFILLFEKNGFIPRLDQYVWEKVCAQLRDWKEKGYDLLPVSVNVSRADVYQAHLVDTLVELTHTYGIDPAYLHLEITESAYAEHPEQIISTVEQLRKLGFIIEMDDFGSGYSSLNMLSQMTLDILKLDMKFIQSEMAKPAEQSILNDIITMAHRMHLNVVAEGVETRVQLERLRDIGCDYVQGFFLAKPMPIAKFEALWQSQHKPCPASALTEHHVDELRRLLVADEDIGYRAQVRKAFEGEYEVLEAVDAESAFSCIEAAEGGVLAVILSMTLPQNGAVSLMKTLRQDPAFWKIPILATIPSGESRKDLSLALEANDFLCKCHPMFDLHRRIEHLVEMADARAREAALRHEASRDPLTGLLNRRGLKTAIASLRTEETPLAVCLFDLDDFKLVNDTYGHEAGDRMIQTFADLLRRQTRAEDVQCRYGGDEFLVILKRLKEKSIAIKKGADICRMFREHFAAEQLPAACSGGVALCGADEKPSAALIERADQALYRAKRENKGSCCLWEAQGSGASDQE